MRLRDVTAVLDSLRANYALIGAVALAARGYPRFTRDIDLLTTDRGVLQQPPWSTLHDRGFEVEIRRGDEQDPLAGVVRIRQPGEPEIDLLVGRHQWQRQLIDRADPTTVGDTTVPIPRVSDLILLKLFAGGFRDIDDVRALLALGDRERVAAEVNEWIADLGAEAENLWRRILAESNPASDRRP